MTEHQAPLQKIVQDLPELEGDEVLLKVRASGVCHSDLHFWEGGYDLGDNQVMNLSDRGVKLPLTMGHEIVGELVALGPEAQGLALGESYLVYPWLGCGTCDTCAKDQENLCPNAPRALGIFTPGGYAQYVVVPRAKYCLTLGDLDPAEAAPLACSGVTTYSALKKFGDDIRDTPVVILGAGGLGHMALRVIRALGGKGAVFVDLDEAKRTAVLEAGALAAIDGNAPDADEQIKAATGGGALLVLDLVGAEATINLGLAAARKGVRIVVVGLFGGQLKIPTVYFPIRAMAVIGSYVGNLNELSELLELAKSGKLSLAPVTRRPLQDANDALMDLKDGKVIGRVVLTP
ncbi:MULTISPECIES: alcohol dehydrogenase [unclassified Ruegeria]|uniref:alcohol dehydrogenase n=1 Tax=unclassified Ruegeria TaxID=2625375 RepID=UPI001C2BF5EC